eukprot:3705365-Prorocentrum_lima.AAC.1
MEALDVVVLVEKQRWSAVRTQLQQIVVSVDLRSRLFGGATQLTVSEHKLMEAAITVESLVVSKMGHHESAGGHQMSGQVACSSNVLT